MPWTRQPPTERERLNRITCEPAGGGTRVVYDADLALKGAFKLADPLLRVAFGRIGDHALAGLRRALEEGQ